MKTILSIILVCSFISGHAQTCVPNSNSLLFDGTGAYVDMGSANSLSSITGPITIEAWIYSNAWGFNYAQNTILCSHGWTSGEQGMVLRAGGNGELSFNIAGLDQFSVPTSWQEVLSPANSIQLNTWTHVAGTFSGTELKVFVNGLEVGNTLFTGTIVPSTYGVKIGKLADDNQSPGRYFNGYIDEVRVWNRALSASELSDSAFVQIDPLNATDLVAYWRFNEGSGATTSDLGSGSTTGALLNSSWSTLVPFNSAPPTPIVGWNGSALTSSAIQNNQWYLGGNIIAGAQGTSYVPTQNGSYTVVFTGANGCSASSLPYLISTVGIEEAEDLAGRIKLGPNPANNFLNVLLAGMADHDFQLKVYDMHQRLLWQEHVENFSGENYSIKTEAFSTGIYRLSLESKTMHRNLNFIISR